MKKTYLSKLSPEIITKRLQDGDVVKFQDKDIYKLVNGIPIRFSTINNSNVFWVGGYLIINEENDYYFEDPEPITEPGFYKTREGRKVIIYSIKPNILFGVYDGEDTLRRWNQFGKAYMNDRITSKEEIAGKWEEK